MWKLINVYLIESCLTFSDFEAQLQAGTFQLIPDDAPLQHLPSSSITATDALKCCQGQRVSAHVDSGVLRVYCEDGRFLGIGESKGDVLIPQMVLEGVS